VLTTGYAVNYTHSSVSSTKATVNLTGINKALGMCRMNITVSNNSTISLNPEFKKLFLVYKTHYMIMFVH